MEPNWRVHVVAAAVSATALCPSVYVANGGSPMWFGFLSILAIPLAIQGNRWITRSDRRRRG